MSVFEQQFLAEDAASHGFGVILATQLALIVAYPLAGNEGPRPGWFGELAMALFLLGIFGLTRDRRVRAAATSLFVPAAALNLATPYIHSDILLVAGVICALLYFAFITFLLLRTVVLATKVTTDTLYGAVAAYLFIAIVWGMAYSIVDQLAPGSLRCTYEAGRHLSWADYSYFSVVTLTTIGYGDFVPVGGIRALVTLEAIIGAMYPAILIGRLLTLYVEPKRSL